MKAFIEIKKEQKLKKKRPKSGNIYKIPIIRNDNSKKKLIGIKVRKIDKYLNKTTLFIFKFNI